DLGISRGAQIAAADESTLGAQKDAGEPQHQHRYRNQVEELTGRQVRLSPENDRVDERIRDQCDVLQPRDNQDRPWRRLIDRIQKLGRTATGVSFVFRRVEPTLL